MTTSPAAALIGTSAVARCSFAARESGVSIGTESITASSAVGPGVIRSTSTSRRHATSASTGRIAPHRDEGGAGAEKADDSRGNDRAECDSSHRQAPEGAEDACEDIVGDDSLQERERGHVLDRVGRPDHGEQKERRREEGGRRHQRDRKPPEDQRDAERNGEPAPLELESGQRADQASHTEGSGHVADGGRVPVEDAECRDHDQDVQTTPNEGLCADEPDHHSRRRRPCDVCKARQKQAVRALLPGLASGAQAGPRP